ncbi:MAG: rhomboid family intramembrane serine protease [Candidatus Aenigmarchaeota archaeon]|nr:rhomboid family intramembrane serine protease [Candidatus Aenigmarchaeota archaeon]
MAYPKLTLSIILLNFIAYALQLAIPGVTETFSLTPNQVQPYQFFTYMFMHDPSGVFHILINMVVLIVFSGRLEKEIGWKPYLFVYLAAGLGSAFLYLGLPHDPDALLLGASGSIFGVMAAFAVLYPAEWIFIPPGIPLPAIAAIVIVALIELFSGALGLAPNIANFGHLGGIITGVAFMAWWKYLRRKPVQKDFEFVWE